jgi:hypothetical protein
MNRSPRQPNRSHRQPSGLSFSSRPVSRRDVGSINDAESTGVGGQGLNTPPTDDESPNSTILPGRSSQELNSNPITRTTNLTAPNRHSNPFNQDAVGPSSNNHHVYDSSQQASRSSGELNRSLTPEPDFPPPRYSQDFSERHTSLNQSVPQAPVVSDIQQYIQDSLQPNQGDLEPEVVNDENDIDVAWDLVLPLIQPPSNLSPASGFDSIFNIRDLVGATQDGATAEMLHNYLANFEKQTISRVINDDVDRYPAMFYAVATNEERVIRLWVKCGGDLNAIDEYSGVPLLAFTIMYSEVIRQDTSKAVV